MAVRACRGWQHDRRDGRCLRPALADSDFCAEHAGNIKGPSRCGSEGPAFSRYIGAKPTMTMTEAVMQASTDECQYCHAKNGQVHFATCPIAEAPVAMYDAISNEEFLEPVTPAQQLEADAYPVKCAHCPNMVSEPIAAFWWGEDLVCKSCWLKASPLRDTREQAEIDAGEDERAYVGGVDLIEPSVDDRVGKQLDNMDLSKGGVKYDSDKARLDLLAPEFILGVGDVLTYGAHKYADRNWEKGMRWGRCVGAALRHIFAWMRGEDIDPESKLHHLDHAACCLMFLRTYVARQIGEDDRKRVFN